jgi:hypothetical protein
MVASNRVFHRFSHPAFVKSEFGFVPAFFGFVLGFVPNRLLLFSMTWWLRTSFFNKNSSPTHPLPHTPASATICHRVFLAIRHQSLTTVFLRALATSRLPSPLGAEPLSVIPAKAGIHGRRLHLHFGFSSFETDGVRDCRRHTLSSRAATLPLKPAPPLADQHFMARDSSNCLS